MWIVNYEMDLAINTDSIFGFEIMESSVWASTGFHMIELTNQDCLEKAEVMLNEIINAIEKGLKVFRIEKK